MSFEAIKNIAGFGTEKLLPNTIIAVFTQETDYPLNISCQKDNTS